MTFWSNFGIKAPLINVTSKGAWGASHKVPDQQFAPRDLYLKTMPKWSKDVAGCGLGESHHV